MLKRFGDHAGAINVNLANSSATSAVAFGNVYAQAFGKIVSYAQQAVTATSRLGVEAVATGIRFNAQMETSRLGIASLVSSFGEIRDAQGALVTGANGWAASLHVAEDVQKRLRVLALQTTAEYSDLLQALQVAMGPALAAGFSTDQVVKFTQTVAQSAAAIGLPMRQLEQEIRSLFAGDIGPDSRLANLLFTDIPRTKIKAYVDELKSSGQFFDEMQKRMAAFALAGEQAANTFNGALSNLKDAITQALGEATQGATSDLTEQIKALTAEIVTFDSANNAIFNEDFVDGVHALAGAFVELAGAGVTLVKELPNYALFFESVGEWAKQNAFALSLLSNPISAPGTLVGMATGVNYTSFDSVLDEQIDRRQRDRAIQASHGRRLESELEATGGVSSLDSSINWFAVQGKRNQENERAAVDAQKAAERLSKEIEKQNVLAWKVRDAYGEFETHEGQILKIEKERLDLVREIQAATLLSPQQRSDLEMMADAIAGRQKLGVLVDQSAGVVGGDPAQNEKAREALNNLYDTVLSKTALKAAKIYTDKVHEYREWQEEREAEIWAKAVSENMKDWEQNFAAPLSNVFYDLATTGGHNFGQIAGDNFNRMIGDGASLFTDKLAEFFGGGKAEWDESSGQWMIDGKPATQGQLNANNTMGQLAGYASIGIGSYMNPKASGQDQSILGGAASGAMSGFSMSGNWVGAVIGAVVGAAGTYFGNQAVYDDYKYGIPGINVSNGQASLNYTDNMRPAEIEEWTAKIQAQYDKFWNGYVDIILKFGDSKLIPAFTGIDGQFQSNPSKNFLKHLNEWINGTLPDELAGMFKESMSTLYTGMGLTMEGFESFWQRFDGLDPSKALALWGELADALINFQTSITAFGGVITPGQSGFTLGGQNSFTQIMSGERDRNQMTFADTLRESDVELMNLADSLEHLTGEEQIHRAREISDLNMERYENEKQYAQQLLQAMEEVNRTWDAMVRSLTLDGFKDSEGNTDYKAQVDYLYDYLNDLYQRMGTATSPEELQFLNSEAANVLNQILGIAQNSGDPAYYEAMRKWALETIDHLRTQTADRITALGQAVSDANAAFLEKFNPIFTAFQNAFQTAADVIGGNSGGGANGPGGGGGGLVNDFDDLRTGARGLNSDFSDLGSAVRELIADMRAGRGSGANARAAESSYDYGAAVAARRRRVG
ncbi:MAG: hypothetical protein ACSLFQ_10125 [Thermoanaerobaculia bacterium]